MLHDEMLIAIGGYSGTGKTTLGCALQNLIKQPNILVCPDRTRLDILSLEAGGVSNHHMTSEINQRVIQEMHKVVMEKLSSGFIVIVPSAFLIEDMRYQFANTAKELRTNFIGFWLDAPDDILIQRINNRLSTKSDSQVTPDILELQKTFPIPDDWVKIDAAGTLDSLLSQVVPLLPNHIKNVSCCS